MDIELRQNNVYRNGVITTFIESNESILLRDKLNIENFVNNQYHIVTDFDRLDLLAYKYYSEIVDDSSKYWWVIADVNNIMNPLDLSELVGTQIIIPDLLRIIINL